MEGGEVLIASLLDDYRLDVFTSSNLHVTTEELRSWNCTRMYLKRPSVMERSEARLALHRTENNLL
jgi:hypothetical protein